MAYHLPHQPRRHCSQTHQSGQRISCEANTLNSLKILQEFSKIHELTPRILENSPVFYKYLLNFRSILTIRGLLMAYRCSIHKESTSTESTTSSNLIVGMFYKLIS